jgi:hypothetical protein
MNLDTVVELICQVLSEKFDGVEYNAKELVISPPDDNAQKISVRDYDDNIYHIEVRKI